MQPASSTLIPDGLLAAMALLSENSRLGLKSKNPALHPGHNLPNFTAAIGDSWSVASETRWSHEMGRFLSPDPGNISGIFHMDTPQSWNGYAYAGNNPLTNTDPTGDVYQVCDANGQNCSFLTDQQFQNEQGQNQRNGEISRTVNSLTWTPTAA